MNRRANETQIEAIGRIKALLDYWATSNDMGSPSHYTEIQSEIGMLEFDGMISEEQEHSLIENANKLFESLKELNPNTK